MGLQPASDLTSICGSGKSLFPEKNTEDSCARSGDALTYRGYKEKKASVAERRCLGTGKRSLHKAACNSLIAECSAPERAMLETQLNRMALHDEESRKGKGRN